MGILPDKLGKCTRKKREWITNQQFKICE